MSSRSSSSSPAPLPPGAVSEAIAATAEAALSVHVVEDHHEALPHIYRAIARKTLPYQGNILLHFDAHPDLLSPDIHADNVTNKDQLFSKTDIADWILPAVYMGHFCRVVWLKPPWATQMTEGCHQLCVGRDRASGHLRVSSPLPYFISELLCVEKNNMDNCVTIPLDVVTLHPSPITSCSPTPCPHTSSPERDPQPKTSMKRSLIEDSSSTENPSQAVYTPSPKRLKLDTSISETGSNGGDSIVVCTPPWTAPMLGRCDSLCTGFIELSANEDSQQEAVYLPPPKRTRPGGDDAPLPQQINPEIINALTNSDAWVLDIDLDFFSTGNPFRSIYSEEQYQLLKRLYMLQEPQNENPEGLKECIKIREKQLSLLKQLWNEMEISSELKREFNLSPHDEILIKDMKALKGKVHNDSSIDNEHLHMSGLLTDLPVHTSSEREIAALIKAMCSSLQAISKRPSLVTIARSTDDEYTPSEQVFSIQKRVLSTLQCLYGNGTPDHQNPLDIKCHYCTHDMCGDDDELKPPQG